MERVSQVLTEDERVRAACEVFMQNTTCEVLFSAPALASFPPDMLQSSQHFNGQLPQPLQDIWEAFDVDNDGNCLFRSVLAYFGEQNTTPAFRLFVACHALLRTDEFIEAFMEPPREVVGEDGTVDHVEGGMGSDSYFGIDYSDHVIDVCWLFSRHSER